jgi:hypothetical protein
MMVVRSLTESALHHFLVPHFSFSSSSHRGGDTRENFKLSNFKSFTVLSAAAREQPHESPAVILIKAKEGGRIFQRMLSPPALHYGTIWRMAPSDAAEENFFSSNHISPLVS